MIHLARTNPKPASSALGKRLSGVLARYAAVSIAALWITNGPTLAADKMIPLKFGIGHAASTQKGTIKGYNGTAYVFDAAAGRTVSILFSPSNRSCYFNLTRKGEYEAIFIGSSAGNEFAGVLAKGGTYTVQTYLMRNAARRNETCRYTITIEFAPS